MNASMLVTFQSETKKNATQQQQQVISSKKDFFLYPTRLLHFMPLKYVFYLNQVSSAYGNGVSRLYLNHPTQESSHEVQNFPS